MADTRRSCAIVALVALGVALVASGKLLKRKLHSSR